MKKYLLTTALVTGMALTAMPSVAATMPDTLHRYISIMHGTFTPTSTHIIIGTVVKWTNKDTVTHNVLSVDNPPAFISHAIKPGKSFSFTFDKLGSFNYRCTTNGKMGGVIIVTTH